MMICGSSLGEEERKIVGLGQKKWEDLNWSGRHNVHIVYKGYSPNSTGCVPRKNRIL